MRVEITVLGGFAVSVDGVVVPPARWHRRQAATLVKLLALAPRARLHRDRVVDALWPDLHTDVALPRLHKAAHYARQALGARDAVVLKDEVVALFPAAKLDVDAVSFETAADAALRSTDGTADACEVAIALYGGELLPDDLNEAWSEEPRLRLNARYEQLLGEARRRREPQEAARTPAPAPVRPAEVLPTLLERDDELGALVRMVRAVLRTGRGAVALVSGEAGSGKSALSAALRGRVADEILVAVGGCDDLLAPRSLGPFRDMAEALPGLASALSGTAAPGDVLPALLRFLAATPAVLVVEDVHWADDATLDAVRYLSRRIAAVPAVLLLTFRPEDVEATHPLRRVLGSLGSSSTRRIELAPLSVDGVRRLAGVTESDAAEIHRITRGNPFFVTEVLAAGGDGVPATVRDAVLARVGRLPTAARRLAERIAVVPSRSERWLAESLAGEPDALVHLERSGVVTGGPEHVAFRHELARQAIESSLTVGELVRANREVLDVALQRPQVEPSRVVHHAVRALRLDVLLRYGPVAADEARRAGAHRQAAETLRVVLEHADRLEPEQRARLLTQRAYSLYVVNKYEEALACAESAVAVVEPSGPSVLFAEALMVLSRIVYFARGPMLARRAAGRAVAVLEGLDDDARLAAALIELARGHSNLATVGIVAHPDPDALRHADRALVWCDRLGRDDLRAQALCYLGSGRLAHGDPRGAADIERAIALEAAETRLEQRVRTYVNAAGSAYRAGRFDDAERYAAQGLRLAADGEFVAGEYRLDLTLAMVSASRGEWDHAIAELRRLLDGPRGPRERRERHQPGPGQRHQLDTGQPGVMSLLARSALARLLARVGDPDAGAVLAEAWRDPASGGDSFVAGPLAAAQAELDWLAGTAGPVPSRIESALALAAESGHTAMAAEVYGYLRRAGHVVPVPGDAPGPWGPALSGRWREAAAAWQALGERYEHAVELALSGDEAACATGLEILTELGAVAAIAVVNRRRPATAPDR